ncbi:hypothetical protein ACWEPC_28380 [Nonomuraea sp. NPDC004297]
MALAVVKDLRVARESRIRPILLTWSDRYDHLREVTRDDVHAALDRLHGQQRRHALISLRSLFSRAKKNGAIFRDPTRGLKVGQHPYGVLQPLLSDDIDQSVQAVKTPAARVMVALAGVHAVAHRPDLSNADTEPTMEPTQAGHGRSAGWRGSRTG